MSTKQNQISSQNIFLYKVEFSLLVWPDLSTCICSFSLHIYNSITCTSIVSTYFYIIFNSFCKVIPPSFIPLETLIIIWVFVLGSLIWKLTLTLSCYLALRRWIMWLFSRATGHSSSHAHVLLVIVYGIRGFYIYFNFFFFIHARVYLHNRSQKNGHLKLKFYCFYDGSKREVTCS